MSKRTIGQALSRFFSDLFELKETPEPSAPVHTSCSQNQTPRKQVTRAMADATAVSQVDSLRAALETEPTHQPYTSIGSIVIKAMVERPDRPCDGCGSKARCAPNKRFGGMLCAPCALRIVEAEKALQPKQTIKVDPTPPTPPADSGLRRRGVTQFAGKRTIRAREAVADLRALECAYRVFRREPTSQAREALIDAINTRCSTIHHQTQETPK